MITKKPFQSFFWQYPHSAYQLIVHQLGDHSGILLKILTMNFDRILIVMIKLSPFI